MNIDVATSTYKEFLLFRKKNNVDAIREDIIYGGKNTPWKFPKGNVILPLAPQIIIAPNSIDKRCQPLGPALFFFLSFLFLRLVFFSYLAFEAFGFNPKEAFKVLTKEEYLVFLTYCLEYRAIVMEQMSHEYEEKYLRNHPDPSTRKDGYGVVLLFFSIRDMKGNLFCFLAFFCFSPSRLVLFLFRNWSESFECRRKSCRWSCTFSWS
jgi:hypothetical protein